MTGQGSLQCFLSFVAGIGPAFLDIWTETWFMSEATPYPQDRADRITGRIARRLALPEGVTPLREFVERFQLTVPFSGERKT
jgi:hypothetical protein